MARRAAHTKERSTRNRVLLFIEVVCIIVALVCAGFFIWTIASRYVLPSNEFKEITTQTNREIPKLRQLNGDAAGWVIVEDTRIDYPVMYTPDDPEHYLHLNVDGEYSAAGTPFFGEGSDPENPNTNSMIVYAHHMRDGSMFGQLEKFADRQWALEHPITYIDEAGQYSYRVIGAWHEDLSRDGYYRYWDHVGALSEEQFDEFVNDVEKHSAYSTDAKVSYGDKLLMLSTCSYGTSEERFVVVAVRE